MPDPPEESSKESEDSSSPPPRRVDTFRRYLGTDHLVGQTLRDMAVTLCVIMVLATILFMYTGLWPPFVSVISGSMEPELERGDLVLITDVDPAEAPEYAHDGIVSKNAGAEHGDTSMGAHGDVIVFTPNNTQKNADIIHRAIFHVDEGENWYDRANPEYLNAANCTSLRNCPAPHDGFITRGDANTLYDQASGISGPVPTTDVRGVAEFDVPYAGYLRLMLGPE